MASAMLERAPTAASAVNFGFQAGPAPTATPSSTNWCLLPRCELKFEKCAGGCKIYCVCPDEVSCATLQNLCNMVCDGLCNCCCTLNGVTCCQVNLCCGTCRCETTKNGCCITWTSGDKACCELIQSCCDTLACCCENGCCCYISFGNTAVCCGKCA